MRKILFLSFFIYTVLLWTGITHAAQPVPPSGGTGGSSLTTKCTFNLPGTSTPALIVRQGESLCQRYSGNDMLWSCNSTPGTSEDCGATGGKCWFTDVLHTQAACFVANAPGCVVNGTLYNAGDQWCDGYEIKTCKDPARNLEGFVQACNPITERCMTTDPYKKTAACFPRSQEGCDYHGVFYPTGSYLCSDDRTQILKCDGTGSLGGKSTFSTAAQCLSESCHQASMDPQGVTCLTNQSSIPLDATQLNQIISRSQCGVLGAQCCDPGGINRLPIPDKPDFNNVVLNGVIGTVFDFLRTLATPVYNIFNNGLDKITPRTYCYQGVPRFSDPKNRSYQACVCADRTAMNISALCDNISSTVEKSACEKCVNNSDLTKRGLWTSIGCLSYNFDSFIKDVVFGMGIGFAGVFALACIIYSAFTMQMSQGDAQKVKKSQEYMTSCILGLMLIIFSVFILRVIGVDILRIPGFGK